MRSECAAAITRLAEDENFVGMGTDGHMLFEGVRQRFPERYIDVGVAEANLIGVASGLARSGKRVVVSAIASFLLRRAYEQIHIDISYPDLPVVLVGVGGGLSYGTLGATHHMTCDIALMQVLPNMATFVPSDASEASNAMETAFQWAGPAYLRLGARLDPQIHTPDDSWSPGEPEILRNGSDLMIVATGYCVHQALLAAERLATLNFDVGVTNVHTLRPLNHSRLLEIITATGKTLVVEEHLRSGGLGSIVTELLQGYGSCQLECLGITNLPAPVGDRQQLIDYYGLGEKGIVDACRDFLENTPSTRQRLGKR